MSELLTDSNKSKDFVLGLRTAYMTPWVEGVTVVTCTNKLMHRRNIFQNFVNQTWGKLELIVILNRDDLNIKEWKQLAETYNNVSVHRVSQTKSLGHCYNIAAGLAKYNYIATFDDDDYYAPNYIKDLMLAFRYSNADIVGKKAYYLYFKSNNLLAIRNHTEEYKYLDENSFLDGGKKIVRRKVFEQVDYRNISNCEDVYFSKDSMKKGFTIFSADKYNLVYMRKKNKAMHTWKVTDQKLLGMCTVIKKTDYYKKIACI
jgi:cellulose synthase/poly-beta-1,6-N-acetylglucosamine synthase-like glycosyltransferase